MRVLIHASAPGAQRERVLCAARGLALRGHRVHWWGPVPPGGGAGLLAAPRGLAVARLEVDVVIGAGGSPARVAGLGWLTRARAMVLGLAASDLEGLGRGAQWALRSIYAMGLVDPREEDALRAGRRPIPLERLAFWSSERVPAGPESAHPDTEILERASERALARQRAHAPRSAMFLDRDGTLVVERGYLTDAGDIELLPGVAHALRRLRSAGFALVVISNQSGVGRGLFPAAQVHEAMARLRAILRASGVELDAIYFCPHRPEAGCACRKPGIALIDRAIEDLLLTRRGSAMVGDKLLDVETGRRAGTLGILVRTGYGREAERSIAAGGPSPQPDAVCDGLDEAASFVLARGDAGEI
jgi:D-glycero-D-manno-heptose 1,7-bisphosphate phosphatase